MKPIIKLITLVFVYSLFISSQNILFAQPNKNPKPGLALIWYGDQSNLDSRDGLVDVGQIMYMWRAFEPKEGKFEFEDLDKELKAIFEKGLKTTIQINGNYHPDFIFNSVPYLKEVPLPGQKDHTIGFGPPMYWNSIYKEKYSNMIHALADHLKKSPYKEVILGIRQSYCAIGTEHHYIPEEYRDSSLWTMNKNVEWGKDGNWTTEIEDKYMEWAIDLYIDAFNPPVDFNVFMRASAVSSGNASEKQLKMLKEGKLWLFQTSSEPQPRNADKEKQYQVFIDHCKSGKTIGFMESWSNSNTSSQGWMWGKTRQPISRAQFNYWTLLCDLHCGVSFPAMRPEDMDDPAFLEDYRFCKKYAGMINSPESSPGAWIAFREGDYLKGDYSFLMDRNPDDKSIALYNLDTEKFGLWAIRIADQEVIRVKLNIDFLMSLENDPFVKIRIWYKDDNDAILRLHAFTKFYSHNKTNSGKWKMVEVPFKILDPFPLIDLIAIGGPLTVHMIEVVRDPHLHN